MVNFYWGLFFAVAAAIDVYIGWYPLALYCSLFALNGFIRQAVDDIVVVMREDDDVDDEETDGD